MRVLILFLLGLALGAAGATITVNALAQRDAYARGVMHVMQHHYAELRNGLRSGHCDATTVGRAREVLRVLDDEIEPSLFADGTPDAPFREYAGRLRDALTALPDTASGCAALAPSIDRIGNACDACHRQYR